MPPRAPSFRFTKPKDVRETSNANRPHRCLRSRIGFLGLGESSRRCRPVHRHADHIGHHDKVVGAVRDGSDPELELGRAVPGLFHVRMEGRSSRRGSDLSSSHHETLTAFRRRVAARRSRRNFPLRGLFMIATRRGRRNGKSVFDDAADQRRDRRSYHLSRDARRLIREAAGPRAGGQPKGTSSSKRDSTARRDDPSG